MSEDRKKLISEAIKEANRLELPTPPFEKMTIDQIKKYTSGLKKI